MWEALSWIAVVDAIRWAYSDINRSGKSDSGGTRLVSYCKL